LVCRQSIARRFSGRSDSDMTSKPNKKLPKVSAAHHQWQAQIGFAEQAAQRWSGDETETKCDADQAEVGSALLRRAHVGDVGARRRNRRTR
jgi:hypothetical protein